MFEDEKQKVTVYKDIDSSLLEAADQAVGRMQILLDDMAFIDSLAESLAELKDACKPVRENQITQHRRIERKAKMFLSEFSILLNHWEKKSKRRSGKKGDMAKFFENLTHNAYDTYGEYGFTYNLRNYTIHGDNAVNQISERTGAPYVLPLANRDFLLSNYKKWKVDEIQFIKKQSEYFDLIPIFEKSFQILQEIHWNMMDQQLTEQTIRDCDLLIDLHKQMLALNPDPGYWDIIEFFDEENSPINVNELHTTRWGSCSRSYANWAVYPYIRGRAEQILYQPK